MSLCRVAMATSEGIGELAWRDMGAPETDLAHR